MNLYPCLIHVCRDDVSPPSPVTVPEPATGLLLGAALVGVAIIKKWKGRS